MGIPVLHGVAGESADIVNKEQVGLVFESDNAQELAQLLIQLRKGLPSLIHYKPLQLPQRPNTIERT